MNVKLDITICGVNISIDFNLSVTTHVVANSDDTQSNKKANENLNPEKRNDNGSAWTLFPNGTWDITECVDTPQQNADVYAEEQLRTNAHQLLPKRVKGSDTIKVDDEGNPIYVDDWGYNIHFTPWSNTAGCIGGMIKR